MDNVDFARAFSDIAAILEFRGESAFKVRAYQRAADVIRGLPEEVAQLANDEKRLRSVPGIGSAIAAKIQEMARTGRLEFLERLKEETPPGLIALIDVPGVGPRLAQRAWEQLGVASIQDLEQAINDGSLAALPRVGEKNAQKILRHLQDRLSQGARVSLGEALPMAERLVGALRERAVGLRKLVIAGSIRRARETIANIDLLCLADDPEDAINIFATLPLVSAVVERSTAGCRAALHNGLHAHLKAISNPSGFGAMLVYLTGSRQHDMRLVQRAQRLGLLLDEAGEATAGMNGGEEFASEQDLYARLGLPWIPPELREDSGEFEAAERDDLPQLVTLEHIRGDLHTHTDWTDGRATMDEMVAAACGRGLEYMAITDHSRSATVARGLDLDRLRLHNAAIDGMRARFPEIWLLKGTEMDILPDGSLDYPDSALAELDIVLGSIHSAMDQPEDQMTARIIEAMRNPHLDVIAHPTTRRVLRRAAVDLDIDAVFKAAVETGTVMEINASPGRLDLRDGHVRRAREFGVLFMINTDAHSIEELDQLRYGVGTARRGWAETGSIVNTLPASEFREWLALPKSERYQRLPAHV